MKSEYIEKVKNNASGRQLPVKPVICMLVFINSLFIPAINAQNTFDTKHWTGAPGSNAIIHLGDLNGDGKTDVFMWNDAEQNLLVNLSIGNGFDIKTLRLLGTTGPVYKGDLNGDKKTDIFFWDASVKKWKINLVETNNKPSYWDGAWGSDGPVNVGDLNDDGKMDVFMWRDAGKDWTINLSNGSGFTTQIWHGAWGSDGPINVGDLNKDGKADVFMWNNSMRNWSINLSTGSGFNGQAWTGAWGSEGQINTGDLNGDGRTDVFMWSSVEKKWKVNLSAGTGFTTESWAGVSGSDGQIHVGDLNGDKKTDVFMWNKSDNSWTINFSTGSGFEMQQVAGDGGYDAPINVGDLNGDGNVDIFMWNESDKSWAVNLSIFPKNIVITNPPILDKSYPPVTSNPENEKEVISPKVEKLETKIEDSFHIKYSRGAGRAVAVSINPVNDNSIWIATPTGGLFKSYDGGNFWNHIDNFPEWGCFDIEICPTDSNTILVTCIEDTKVQNGGGVWVSKDGGNSWVHPSTSIAKLANGMYARYNAYGISFQPGTQNIYVGTDSGLIVSNDLGITWRFIYPNLPGNGQVLTKRPGSPNLELFDFIDHSKIEIYSIVALSNGKVITFGTRGVLISDQSLNNWHQPNTVEGEGFADWRIHNAIAASPLNDDHLFFTNKYENLFYSIDGGENWKKIETPYLDEKKSEKPIGTRQVFVKVTKSFLSFIGDAIDLYYAQFSGVAVKPLYWNGTDYSFSANWEHILFLGGDPTDLAFSKDNKNIIYATDDGGIKKYDILGLKSTGLGIPKNNYDAFQVYDVKSVISINDPSKNNLFFGTQDNRLFASEDNGISWPISTSIEGGWFQGPTIEQNNNFVLNYWNAYGSQYYKTESQFFNNVPNSLSFLRKDENLVYPIYYALNNKFVAFYIEDTGTRRVGIYISTDQSKTWPNTDIPSFFIDQNYIHNPCFVSGAEINPSIILPFSVNCKIGLLRIDNAFNQIPIDEIISSIPLPGDCLVGTYGTEFFPGVASFGVDPKDPNFIIISDVYNDSIYITNDGGIHWTTRADLQQLITDNSTLLFHTGNNNRPSFELSSCQVSSIAFDPLNSNNIMIGSAEAGILFSNDHGNTWSRIPGSKQIPNITSFAFLGNNQAFASTWGRGLWKIYFDGSKTKRRIKNLSGFFENPGNQKYADEIYADTKYPYLIIKDDVTKRNGNIIRAGSAFKLLGKNWLSGENNPLTFYIDGNNVNLKDVSYNNDGTFTVSLPKLNEPRMHEIRVVQNLDNEKKNVAILKISVVPNDKELKGHFTDSIPKEIQEPDQPRVKSKKELKGSRKDTIPKEIPEQDQPGVSKKPITSSDCSKSIDYWFNNTNNTWPDVNGSNPGNVMIGGSHFTEQVGRAIANSAAPYGKYDIKHAFMLMATLKLSNVAADNPVWNYANICENWLTTIGKITPDNLQSTNPKIGTIIKLIDEWIKEHICN